MKLFLIFCVAITWCCVQTANILGVYPFPSHSHYGLGNTIFKELANRGHNVTVISPFKEIDPPQNYKQILVDNLIEKIIGSKKKILNQMEYNVFQKINWLDTLGINFTDWTLSEPSVKLFLKQKNHFDLVIFHQFMSDAYNGFCHHFSAPCIAITSMTAPGWVNKKIANPGPLSYVPQLLVDYPANMNFFQRFYNTFVYIVFEFSYYFYLRPNQSRLLNKHFPNAPPLDDLYYNISLILINSHVSVDDVVPYMPNLIPIAGAHLQKPKLLSIELQRLLDGAKNGVIYFSMGASIKCLDISEKTQVIFLNLFSRLKQTVLWKWECPTLPNKTSNIFVRSWFPQQDILAHPNVKLFITQGGLMSFIEAVHYAVPVLGVPIFVDQALNMGRAEVGGYGKRIYYEDLSEYILETSVNEMLRNPGYQENAKKRSLILKDQVIPPLEKAIFWIEYVIRHNGAPHLQSAALSLRWYQYYLLDVIVQTANILGVYPFPSYSHYGLGNTIFKELANRGHKVTVISPFKEINPTQNYNQILVDNLIEKGIVMKKTIMNHIGFNVFQKVNWIDSVGINFTDWALSEPSVKIFLKQKHNFDLVIFHQFMSDAYNGFCHHFSAPCIAITSMTAPGWINKKIANPGSLSYVPQLLVDYPANMNFFQRCYNTFVFILFEFSYYFYLRPNQSRLLSKHFPNAPPFDDLYYNISLILINSHVSVDDVVPYMPNLIPIAGAHIRKPKPLPMELQTFLDGATEGVIFFSMGSTIKCTDISEQTQIAFFNVFSRLKQKVLWKWEGEALPNKTDNILVRSWLPQQDILAHSNVKLFITHGGLMSVIESVHYAVPILGIPIFVDQALNIARAEVRGYGKLIFYDDVNEDVLETSIHEILHNPRYKENAMKQSFILKDQIIPPLENAIFWIEYVIRHNGAPHLKSAALKLTWYQYYLLDVIGFALIILILVLLVLKFVFKLIWNIAFTIKKVDIKKKHQ
ncbi:hypothetical protein FQR65_LT02029 [Abscondita terminalis]|nr:hypothetical protein FQR65_LT02029 [Abscondita terminalis]